MLGKKWLDSRQFSSLSQSDMVGNAVGKWTGAIPRVATILSEPQMSFCCWLSSTHSSWSKYTVMSSNVTGAWKEKWRQVSTNFLLGLPQLCSWSPEGTPTLGTDQTRGGSTISLHTGLSVAPHRSPPPRASHRGNETASSRKGHTLEPKCCNEGWLWIHNSLPECTSPAVPRDPLLLSQFVRNNQRCFFLQNLERGKYPLRKMYLISGNSQMSLRTMSVNVSMIKMGNALKLRTIFHWACKGTRFCQKGARKFRKCFKEFWSKMAGSTSTLNFASSFWI